MMTETSNVRDIRGALTSETLARGITSRFWREYGERLQKVLKATQEKHSVPAGNDKAFERKSNKIRKELAAIRASLWACRNWHTPSNPKSKTGYPVDSIGLLRPVDGNRLELMVLIIPHPKSEMRTLWLGLESPGFTITRHAIQRMIQRLRCQTLSEAMIMLGPVTRFFWQEIYMKQHVRKEDGTFPEPNADGLIYTVHTFRDPEQADKMFSVEYRIGFDELEKCHYLATVIVDGAVLWAEFPR